MVVLAVKKELAHINQHRFSVHGFVFGGCWRVFCVLSRLQILFGVFTRLHLITCLSFYIHFSRYKYINVITSSIILGESVAEGVVEGVMITQNVILSTYMVLLGGA